MADSTRKKIITAIGAAFDDATIWGVYPTVMYAQQTVVPADLPTVIVTPDVEEAQRRYGQDLMTMPVVVSLAASTVGRPVVAATEDMLAFLRETVPTILATGIPGLEDVQYARGGVEEWPELGAQSALAMAVFNVIYATAANRSTYQ